jgi:hypothetical protein
MTRIREIEDPDTVDESVIDALFSGMIDARTDPSSTDARLARLFADLRTVDRSESVADQQAVRELFRREFGGADGSGGPEAAVVRGARATRRVGRKAAALGVVFALGASGVAAAAGVLPDPLQRRFHDALAEVGISVPDGPPRSDRPGAPATSGGPDSTNAVTTPSDASSDPTLGDPTTSAGRGSPGSHRGGPDAPPGNGTEPAGSANPSPGGSANPSPGGSANPNPGGSANPNPGGSANPNPGGSANPNPGGSANPNPGRPANAKEGGSANANPGRPANPNPGGSANPNRGRPPGK